MTRHELPLFFNDQGLTEIGVEVGVDSGDYSIELLRQWKGRTLVLVDSWSFTYERRLGIDRYNEAVERLAPFKDRTRFIRQASTVAAAEFEDNSLDWVYLDADHSYYAALSDLHAWYPKLKPGGIIAGHDYLDVAGDTWPLEHYNNPNQGWDRSELKLLGVVSAVRDFRLYSKLEGPVLETDDLPHSFYWVK